MANQITLPAGNTQISQRKNALAHSATDTTTHRQKANKRQAMSNGRLSK